MSDLSFLATIQPLSSHDYAIGHLAWRQVSQQQQALVNWLEEYAAQCTATAAFNVLSIGSGAGILDNPFLSTLQKQPINKITYHGVDPNQELCHLFQKNMQSLANSKTSIEVSNTIIEEYPNKDYDLALAVHVLYYSNQPTRLVDIIIDKLKPQGTALLFVAANTPLSKYFDYVLAKTNAIEPLLSHRLEKHLKNSGYSFYKQTIHTTADVTECFTDSPTGTQLLSFICHGDVNTLPLSAVEQYRQDLKTHTTDQQHKNLIQHDVDVFVIKKP